ncbi:MAG: hypothetical protein K9M75_05155 [Phycisphaerae bacterium]|nr:hypothetical protein [Phycisphaerae bacterium]
MHFNNDPPAVTPHNIDETFKSLQANPELLKLEPELRRRYLLRDDNVQWLIEKASICSDENSTWAISQLRMVLEAESIEDMRTGNMFGPMAPPQLLSKGDIHLFNQANGIPWKIPSDALTRGMLLTGPQGGGKTRFLIWLCHQLNQSGIPFFILDPKLGLKEWANYLNATYIDVEDISIDLSPPPGLTYEQFLPALAPQIGDILGLIYGTEILQEAVQICIDLRRQCIQQGKNTEISLFDIYQAVPSIKDASKGRRLGYREAVTTSLGRILTGSGNLFKCRKGIDLSTLFNHNVILGCRSVTDDFAAKFLALFLLYWLHESERYSPPSDRLKRVLIFDDATRYLANRGGFDAASTTSPFVNIFSQLRSSGSGVISTTQIPHLADAGVLALSHTVINVGPLHFGKDKKVLGEMMGLDGDQRQALGKIEKGQAVGFCAGSAFPGVVFGKTCDVSDSEKGSING